MFEAAQLTAHVQNHVSCKWSRKHVNAIAFSDLDLILKASIVGEFVALKAMLRAE